MTRRTVATEPDARARRSHDLAAQTAAREPEALNLRFESSHPDGRQSSPHERACDLVKALNGGSLIALIGTLGPHVEVRVELTRTKFGRQRVNGRFACPCGWVGKSSADRLVVPNDVKAHARDCPHAHPEQMTLADLTSGAGAE